MPTEVGARVVAIRDGDEDKKILNIYGEGVYVGYDNPPDFAIPNPRINLDRGKVMWGYACWWGPVEQVEQQWPRDEWTWTLVDVDEAFQPGANEADEPTGVTPIHAAQPDRWRPPPPPRPLDPVWATYCPKRTTKQQFSIHNTLGQAKAALRAQTMRRGEHRLTNGKMERQLEAGALYLRVGDEWQLVCTVQPGEYPSDNPIWKLENRLLKGLREDG